MTTATTAAPLEITDVTDADRAAALAEVARHELTAMSVRLSESVTYTRREIGQLRWLFDRARITVAHREVAICGPSGRTATRFAYLLYAVLEHAACALEHTPFGISFDDLMGHDHPGGGALTWS